jgi:hypothetical protein
MEMVGSREANANVPAEMVEKPLAAALPLTDTNVARWLLQVGQSNQAPPGLPGAVTPKQKLGDPHDEHRFTPQQQQLH